MSGAKNKNNICYPNTDRLCKNIANNFIAKPELIFYFLFLDITNFKLRLNRYLKYYEFYPTYLP